MNEEKLKKGGCIIAPPNKEDAIYEQVFGGEIPQEAFNWEKYLPDFEDQKTSTGCVSFSRLNCAETFARKDGLELNLSDRHLFVISGTTKSGNNLNAVSEAFRTLGIVREEYFAWQPGQLEDQSSHWQEIFDTSSIPADARKYLGGNHSWVKSTEAMPSALAFSPLQIALGIGETYFNDIVATPKQITSYHAVMCYWIDAKGNYYIFDSATKSKKILDKNYSFIMQCKSFRDLPEDWKTIKQVEVKTSLGLFLEFLKKLLQSLGLMKNEQKIAIEQLQEVINELPPQPPPPPPPKYLWDNPVNVRHSIRVICDENKLSVADKNLICAVIKCESGFNTQAKNVNKNGSTDWGIAQFNDGPPLTAKKWWIGPGRDFATPEEVLSNPEKCVRVMLREFLAGRLKNWVCYVSGKYKSYF